MVVSIGNRTFANRNKRHNLLYLNFITIEKHKRILFSGNSYSKEWEEEAARRGLPNRKNTVSAIECLKNKSMTEVLTSLSVLSENEVSSRYEILLESYSKTIQVEALTAVKMIKNQIFIQFFYLI